MAEVKRIDPIPSPPPQPTFDITGLTQNQFNRIAFSLQKNFGVTESALVEQLKQALRE